MHYKGTNCEIIEKGEKIIDDRIYKTVNIKIPKKVGKELRKRIIYNILKESGAMGCIEWWYHGSILYKSKFDFQVLLIFNRTK